MRITEVEPTELFKGTAGRPLQIVRVTLAADAPVTVTGENTGTLAVRVEGPAVSTPRPALVSGPEPGQARTVEVGVELAAPVTEGGSRRATVIAEPGTGHEIGPGTEYPGVRARPAGQGARAEAEIIAAVPGWTMWMVSHFHYDPVWWDTQAQYTETRLLLPDNNGKLPEFRTAFELVGLHLDMALEDPDYKFVLAEIDYLKPYFDTHPERRPELRRLISEGRVEIVGGNYNEPNTNLTCAESTIRNAIYGIGYQRDVLGGDPATAWMLDVFGHDPSYPSLMASAGLTSSAWARGPFHQWGPKGTVGDNTRMQFRSEFEWMSPDGRGLLTAYMPNHYGAGWVMHSRGSLEAAEQAAYAQFRLLKPVAATRNVLLPVGADHVIPCRWSAPIHRDWNARYVWPRFVTALPREFFAAVRDDAARRDIVFAAQTRDMNPVYPGKDVSYIDTKQAQRAAETAVMDGERLATLAWLHGAPYPDSVLDKAWRQLVFGAHHDAITGTGSDQVYLDLLGGWREAYERGDTVRRDAVRHLAGLVDSSGTSLPPPTRADRAIVVFNTLATARDGLVTITLRCPRPGTRWLRLRDGDAAGVPALAEGVRRHPDGTLAEVTFTFMASHVPGLGYRTYWAQVVQNTEDTADTEGPADTEGFDPAGPADPAAAAWSTIGGTVIENDAYLIEADPGRGGGITRVIDKRTGTDLIGVGPGGHGANRGALPDPQWPRQPSHGAPGHGARSPGLGPIANELVVQDEYDYHPRWNEGPWLLMPKGPGTGSATVTAAVRAQRCPIGSRLIATWTMGDLRVTQEVLLWDGAARVEFRTHVDGAIGHDRLLRVRFPLNVPGGLPVYETAAAVIGRPFGPVDTDVGKHWFTLDNPAYTWFGLGSAARVIVRATDGGTRPEAIGVAEVITPEGPGTPMIPNGCREATRSLIAALARQGVTATCSSASGPRYGAIDLDSNLPDVRIALGGPEVNSFTAEVLAAADPACSKELARRRGAGGAVTIWIPAAQTRGAAFVPGADVRGVRDLPVLIVAGPTDADLADAVRAVTAGLAAAEFEAVTPACTPDGPSTADAAAPLAPALAGWSAALLNRGTPGCVVTTEGALNISLMRSCSGWPSGVWIDEPKRTAPDGSSFSWQHWSHTFEYALVSSGIGEGDWRGAGFSAAGQAYNHPLLGCETGIHAGPLPAAASLFPIEVAGPGEVILGALKPRGNPAATGWPGGKRPGEAGAITVRLREPSGRPARVRLGPAGGLQGGGAATTARITNLLEEQDGRTLEIGDGNAVTASLPPSGMVTMLVVPGAGHPVAVVAGEPASGGAVVTGLAGPARAGPAPAAPAPAEPQPVFTRYWLHGKGPAPAGNLPVAVHVSPGRAAIPPPGAAQPGAAQPGAAQPGAAQPGDATSVMLRVTVSAGTKPAAGRIELDVPDGLTADADVGGGAGAGPLSYDLPASGYAVWDVNVRAVPAVRATHGTRAAGRATPPPGRYFLAARITDPAGQVLEDVATIAIGERTLPSRDTPLDELLPLLEADQRATAAELDVTLRGGDLTLAPGERGELVVRLVNRARSQIRGEAQLVSPFGTWDAITPWTQSFTVEPGAQVTARYEVAAPAASTTAHPGAQWWALVKVCYFGRVRYTPAIRVSIADQARGSDERLHVSGHADLGTHGDR